MAIEFDPEAMAAALTQTFGLVQQEFVRRGVEKREKAWVIETESRREKAQVRAEGRREKITERAETRGVDITKDQEIRQFDFAKELSKYNVGQQIDLNQRVGDMDSKRKRADLEWTTQFQSEMNQYFGSPDFKDEIERRRGGHFFDQLSAAALDKARVELLGGIPLSSEQVKYFPKSMQGVLAATSRKLVDVNKNVTLSNKYKNMQIELMQSQIDENRATASNLMDKSEDVQKVIDKTQDRIKDYMKRITDIQATDQFKILNKKYAEGTLDEGMRDGDAFQGMMESVQWLSSKTYEMATRVRGLKDLLLTKKQKEEVNKLREEASNETAKASFFQQLMTPQDVEPVEENLETNLLEAGRFVEEEILEPVRRATGAGIPAGSERLERMPKILTARWENKYGEGILDYDDFIELRDSGKLKEGVLFTSFGDDLEDENRGLFKIVKKKGKFTTVQLERVK